MPTLPTLRFPDTDKRNTYSTDLLQLLETSPIPKGDLAANLSLYLTGYGIRRLLYLNDLYRQIVTVPGYVADFGTRYGHNLNLFRHFWHVYEPANITRAFFGFDTFSGLTSPDQQDGTASCVVEGQYSVPPDYSRHLQELLSITEQALPGPSPTPRTFLIPGDATVMFAQFVEENPQAIFALAYFDFDLYAPTKRCLELLAPRLTKGSIIAFDELGVAEFPGETVALMETFGLRNIRLQRCPHAHCWSHYVVE